jgi:hypothetical protein
VLILCLAFAGFVTVATFIVRKLIKSPARHYVSMWMVAIGVISATMVITPLSLLERRDMSNGRGCVSPTFEFDILSAKQVGLDWWPPRVQCAYGYFTYTNVVWDPKWWTLTPILLVPSAIVLIGVVVREARLRSDPNRPSSDDVLANA